MKRARPEKAECVQRMRDGATPSEEALRLNIPVATIRTWRRDMLKLTNAISPSEASGQQASSADVSDNPLDRALEAIGEAPPATAARGASPVALSESEVPMTSEAVVAMSEGILGTVVLIAGMSLGLSTDEISRYQMLAPSERAILTAMAPSALPAFQSWVKSPKYAGYIYCVTFGMFGIGHAFGIYRLSKSKKAVQTKESPSLTLQDTGGNKIRSVQCEMPRASSDG